MTIKQLLDVEEAYPGADFNVDGQPLTQITIVGQVRAVNPQSPPTSRTGSTTAPPSSRSRSGSIRTRWATATRSMSWTSTCARGGASSRSTAAATSALTACALSKTTTRWHTTCLKRPTYTLSTLGARRGRLEEELAAAAKEPAGTTCLWTNTAAGGGGAAGGSGGGGSSTTNKAAGCSATAQTVFKFLHNAPGGNEGVHLNMISGGTGLGIRDILGAADELLGQGLIYTTIDDETWAVLEY